MTRGGRVLRLATVRARRFWLPLAGLLGLSVLLAGIDAVTPLLYRELINNGIVERSAGPILTNGLLLAAAVSLSVVGSAVAEHGAARAGESFAADLRQRAFGRLETLSVDRFAEAGPGTWAARLTGEVTAVQQAIATTLPQVVRNAALIVFAFWGVMSISWQGGGVLLVSVVLLVLPLQRSSARLLEVSEANMLATAGLTAFVAERLSAPGALLSRLYSSPARDQHDMQRHVRLVRDTGVTASRATVALRAVLGLNGSLLVVAAYCLGGLLAVAGEADLGGVIALATYAGLVVGPTITLTRTLGSLPTAAAALGRLDDLLRLQPTVADAPGAVDVPAGAVPIELRDVCFTYPSTSEPVLCGLSLHVPAGRTVALVGPSGAGKSTVAQLLLRLYDVDSGSVRLGGVDVRHLRLASIRSRVGLIAQETYLLNDTLAANLRYARPSATTDALMAALEEAQLGELVGSLPDGLETKVGDHGLRLSGGERQRVAITRLLLKDPDVVILDEATAHLDPESELAVRDALTRLLRGRTCLVIAHQRSVVRDADEIVVLDGGAVVETGTDAELMARGGRYAELAGHVRAPARGQDGQPHLHQEEAFETGDDHALDGDAGARWRPRGLPALEPETP